MKLRNQLLALGCLAVFGLAGYFYVRMWVVQKPQQIIVFVSDSMTSRHLVAARMYANGADHALAVEGLKHVALMRNGSEDYAVPDTAAATTALATGVRVPHRCISATQTVQPITTILERAKQRGRAVGVVTNGTLAGSTLSPFYAHAALPDNTDHISKQLLERGVVDVALGGGAADFTPEPEGRRKDAENLLKIYSDESRGESALTVVRTKAELETLGRGNGRVLGVFSSGAMAFSNQIESGSDQPSLADMTRRAIELLRSRNRSFMLVVDCSLFTTACEGNLTERALAEALAFDAAVAEAREVAGEKALIVAVGRHSVGGLTLSGFPLRSMKTGDLLGPDSSGIPFITWATGPAGPTTPAGGPRQNPTAYQTAYAIHNAEDMVVAGGGPGAERITGFMDGARLFRVLLESL